MKRNIPSRRHASRRRASRRRVSRRRASRRRVSKNRKKRHMRMKGGARKSSEFVESIKTALYEITGSEWSDQSGRIGLQLCKGHTSFFYKCVLGRLIREYPDLKLQQDKFFWVDGTQHTYMIYDEDGKIGGTIDISDSGNWERRIIIDRSQNFVGNVQYGFYPLAKAGRQSQILYYGREGVKYKDPNYYSFEVDCSKPYP